MARNNSSKALIIGNGFDLAHFLPTSYGDFINFVKILSKYKGDWSKVKFAEIFRIETETQIGFDEDWLSSVGKYYETDKMIFDLSKMQGKLDNAWLKYFKPIHEIETWIDFENEINNALNSVSDFCTVSKKAVNDGFQFSRTRTSQGSKYDFLQHDKACSLYRLGIYIKLKNELGYDVNNESEATLFEINPIYLNNYDVSGRSGVSGFKIIDNLFQKLEETTSIFANYLKEIVGIFSKNVRKELLEKLEYFDEIYTFNYTKTISNFYSNNSKSITCHLHGDIDAENEGNIVLGVNEIDSNVLGISALSFTKYYQTLFKETQSSFLDDEECKTQDFEGVDYFVWGHSLDKSDEKYIKRLFNEISFDLAVADKIPFVEGAHNRSYRQVIMPTSSITVYYHDQASKARLLKNLLDIIGKEVIEKCIRTKHLQLLPSPPIWKE